MLDSMRDWRLDGSAIGRVLIGIFLLALMVTGPSLYGVVTSGERVDEALANPQGPSNVQVMLSFAPGAYHQQELGEHGVFGGIRDHSVILLNVQPSGLNSLSHLYWIDDIVPYERD